MRFWEFLFKLTERLDDAEVGIVIILVILLLILFGTGVLVGLQSLLEAVG